MHQQSVTCFKSLIGLDFNSTSITHGIEHMKKVISFSKLAYLCLNTGVGKYSVQDTGSLSFIHLCTGLRCLFIDDISKYKSNQQKPTKIEIPPRMEFCTLYEVTTEYTILQWSL